MQQTYILIAIIVLAIIFGLLGFVKRKKLATEFSPLAGLAFIFMIAGIIGISTVDNRLIVYGLMGIGVLIAVIDMVMKWKKQNTK